MQKGEGFTVKIHNNEIVERINRRVNKKMAIDKNNIVNRDIERYCYLIDNTIYSLNISLDEAIFLYCMLNSLLFDKPRYARFMETGIEELPSGYAIMHGLDGDSLVAKVSSWSLLQRIALIDAIEQINANKPYCTDLKACMIKIGLVKQA